MKDLWLSRTVLEADLLISMPEIKAPSLAWRHSQHEEYSALYRVRDTDGRRIFSTGRGFRRASSIYAQPCRSASLSRTALGYKGNSPLNGILVL